MESNVKKKSFPIIRMKRKCQIPSWYLQWFLHSFSQEFRLLYTEYSWFHPHHMWVTHPMTLCVPPNTPGPGQWQLCAHHPLSTSTFPTHPENFFRVYFHTRFTLLGKKKKERGRERGSEKIVWSQHRCFISGTIQGLKFPAFPGMKHSLLALRTPSPDVLRQCSYWTAQDDFYCQSDGI